MKEGSNNYAAIVPAHPDFRERPIEEAFTWQEGIQTHDLLYLVIFRSKRNTNVTEDQIRGLLIRDEEAAKEAMTMPGFLLYKPDESYEDLAVSFCLWQSQEQARDAAQQKKHREAIEYAMKEKIYKMYTVSLYQVENVKDIITITPIKDEVS